MKIRNGFVSNSSSSSFVLSLKDKGVQELVDKARTFGVPEEAFGRSTVMLLGKEAQTHVYEYLDMGYTEMFCEAMKVVAKDGVESLVFMNESDEDSGGTLPFSLYDDEELVRGEWETH